MPKMAKTTKRKRHTSATLQMEGMDANRAFTTTFIPSARLAILSGLSALTVLMARRDSRLCAPARPHEIAPMTAITKSSTFQDDLR